MFASDFSSLFSYFGVGVLGGFVLYVIFSLLGFGIYSCLKLIEKGGE